MEKLLAVIKQQKEGYKSVHADREFSSETRSRAQSLVAELEYLEAEAAKCMLDDYTPETMDFLVGILKY